MVALGFDSHKVAFSVASPTGALHIASLDDESRELSDAAREVH